MYKYILEDSQIDQNHQQKYNKIAWNIQPICMHLAGKKKLVAYPKAMFGCQDSIWESNLIP